MFLVQEKAIFWNELIQYFNKQIKYSWTPYACFLGQKIYIFLSMQKSLLMFSLSLIGVSHIIAYIWKGVLLYPVILNID